MAVLMENASYHLKLVSTEARNLVPISSDINSFVQLILSNQYFVRRN